jgi:hypothetical protein
LTFGKDANGARAIGPKPNITYQAAVSCPSSNQRSWATPASSVQPTRY